MVSHHAVKATLLIPTKEGIQPTNTPPSVTHVPFKPLFKNLTNPSHLPQKQQKTPKHPVFDPKNRKKPLFLLQLTGFC